MPSSKAKAKTAPRKTKKRATSSRAKKLQSSKISLFTKRWRLWGGGLLVFLMLLAGGILSERFFGTIGKGVIEWSSAQGMTIADLYIEGREYTSLRSIKHILPFHEGTPLLGFSLKDLREDLSQLPWVEHLSVERHWPDTVYIRIQEKQPYALWHHKGITHVLDHEGNIIVPKPPKRFDHLIVLVGKDANKHALTLITMMATRPTLYQKVTSAIWVDGRRWNVYLDSGQEILLPEQDPFLAWQRLADLEKTSQILSQPSKRIDLRQSDRLVIQGVSSQFPTSS